MLGSTTEAGLLLPLDAGRLCQESVPDRARLVAVGDGCGAGSGAGSAADDVAEFLAEPKPLKTGMSFVGDSDRSSSRFSIAGRAEGVSGEVSEGMARTVAAAALACAFNLVGVPVGSAFSGETDRARSAVHEGQKDVL